jgi:hypothetical protein
MPDTSELELSGTSGGGSKIPSGVMLIGAVAGIVGLVLLLRNSGGGGTTAAGTSINAALGSIQEENMNLLGTTQAGFMQTSQQIAGIGAQDMANYTQLSGQIGQSFSDLNSQEASNFANTNAAIDSGFTTLGGQLSGLGGQLSGISSQVQGYQGQNTASFQHINDLISGLSSMQANGQAQSASYYQNLGALMGELSSEQQSLFPFIQQQTGYLSNLDQAGIGATWSQYNTIMHELHAPGY